MKLKWKKYGTCSHLDESNVNVPRETPAKSGVPSVCLACRSKKTRCDRVRPVCGSCAASNVACHYDHSPQALIADRHPSLSVYHDDTEMSVGDERPTNENHSSLLTYSASTGSRQQGAAQAEQLTTYQHERAKPARLTLESSSVELLANSACGNGESYKSVPLLTSAPDWRSFKEAFLEASMRENTYDVLIGSKKEPTMLPGEEIPVDDWNEYIKQLGIFNRRNSVLLGALWGSLAPPVKSHVSSLRNAHEAWSVLEGMFLPRGSDLALQRYTDLHAVTLRESGSFDNYVYRLETKYHEFDSLSSRKETNLSHHSPRKANSHAESPEAMLCFLFLMNMGPEYRNVLENLCKNINVGGFGSGEKLSFKELTTYVRRAMAMEWEEATRTGGSR